MITDPNALAAIVEDLGGTIDTGGRTFTLPLGEVRNAVPKITQIAGVGVRRVEGAADSVQDTARGPQTFVRLELYDKAEEPDEPVSLLERVTR